MHFAPYAVSGVGMRAEIALALDIFFDRRTNITAAIADHHQAGRDLERFGCHIDQMLCPAADFANANGKSRVANETLINRATIDRNNVAFLQLAIPGNAVHQTSFTLVQILPGKGTPLPGS